MINNLLNPFIIYWDIDPSLSDSELDSRICDEVIKARIFVLNLRDNSGRLSSTTLNVLSRFTGNQPRINLTLMSEALEEGSLADQLEGMNCKVYLEFNEAVSLDSAAGAIAALQSRGLDMAVSFYLFSTNWRDIPAVLKFCNHNNIKELKIPIQRPDREVYHLKAEESKQLGKDIEKIDLTSIKLVIHDPFLWELFHGKNNPNEEGCNAAKTMVCISGNYEVTPCPIMPVTLGSLKEMSLDGIFASEKRKKIRTDISRPPLVCEACLRSSVCRGGCRGRTHVLYQAINKPDPACSLL